MGSDEESNVLLYIVGNGAPGALSFPDDQFLFADQLVEAIKGIKHKNMIVYLDSPESESMFSQFSEDLEGMNVMAVTSSGSNGT